MDRLRPDEVAEWLVNEATDEEYAEALVLTYIGWKRGVIKSIDELTKEDMTSIDPQDVSDMVYQCLDEILFGDEIDAGAWWKRED